MYRPNNLINRFNEVICCGFVGQFRGIIFLKYGGDCEDGDGLDFFIWVADYHVELD